MTAKHDISWLSVREELNVCRHQNGNIDYDTYRRDRLAEIEKLSGIPLIVYATDYLNTNKVRACQGQVDITLADLQGFQEVTKDLPSGPLDVIIHSPGGSADAADSIVQVLRARFNPIRFIVPVAAKSAATMITLAGNEILMPASAELGPIDPQFRISDGAGGITFVPAQVLIDQFDRARTEILANPTAAAVWAPIIQRYGVGLYQSSQNAINLSKNLVSNWLATYMFAGRADGPQLAQSVVDYLADHNQFRSHGKRVSLRDLQSRNVNARDIVTVDPALWTKVEKAWYAVQHTFEGTGLFRLFESSRRKCFAQVIQVVIQAQGLPKPPAGTPA